MNEKYGEVKKNGRLEASNIVDARKTISKFNSLFLASVLMATIFGVMLFAAPVSNAQVPSYTDWAGYNGNQSIYLTTYLSETTHSFTPNPTNGTWNIQYGNPDNTVAVAVGGCVSSPNNDNENFHEFFDATPGVDLMNIYMPVTAVGVSNWTYNQSDIRNNYFSYYYGIDYSEFSVNITDGYPSALTGLQSAFDSGINVSSTYSPGTQLSQAGWQELWSFLSTLPEPFGTAAGAESYEYSLYTIIGLMANPRTDVPGNVNYTDGKFGLDSGMTETGNLSWGGPDPGQDIWGYDTYGSSTVYLVQIGERDFLNSSQIIVGANNVEQYVANGVTTTSTGAYSSVVIDVVPAYTIQGYVTANGNPAVNQELELASSSANYYVHTDSSGFYRFFGCPGTTYTVEVPSSSYGSKEIGSRNTWVNGTWWNFSLQSITFTKSGNLYGGSWSASITGPIGTQNSQPTTGSSITFDVYGNTQYSYTITAPSYYAASPSSGTVTLQDNSATVGISFSPTQTWTASFTETGLPSGQSWSVKLDGNTHSTSAGNGISFTVSAGSHSWSSPYDYYSTTLWYEPDPGSGSFSSPGGYQKQLDFIAVPQSQYSCVYGLAPVLLSNYSRTYAENLTLGESVMTYNFTTHSLEPGTVQAVFITQHSTLYDINGYLKVAKDQDIWTDHGYIQAQNLTSSDKIFDVFNQHFYKVHSVVAEHGSFTLYDFYIKGNQNYVVWSNLMEDRLP